MMYKLNGVPLKCLNKNIKKNVTRINMKMFSNCGRAVIIHSTTDGYDIHLCEDTDHVHAFSQYLENINTTWNSFSTQLPKQNKVYQIEQVNRKAIR